MGSLNPRLLMLVVVIDLSRILDTLAGLLAWLYRQEREPLGRVWEPYLTEQDRAHIVKRPRQPTPLGVHPALLSIDNYRNALGDEPRPLLEAIESWPSSTGLAGWRAIEQTKYLLTAVRSRKLPVIHATQVTEEECGIPGWSFFRSPGGWEAQRGHRGWDAIRDRIATRSERLQTMSAADRGRYIRRYEIVDEVAPVEGEVVLKKAAPSAFWNTPLATHLATMQVDTVIVVGESTSGCIRASVVDAASERLPVIVVEDCVYDRHEASHAINLFDMHRKYAEVLSLEETLDYINGLPA